MKRVLLVSVFLMLVVVGWQRWRIHDLAMEEAGLLSAPAASNAAGAGDPVATSTSEAVPPDPLPDDELPAVLAMLRGVESSFERAGDPDIEIETFRTPRSDLMNKLARLTPAQATSLFEEWMGEEKDRRSLHSNAVTRMALILGQVNPNAALELAAKRIHGAEVFHRGIFSNWFIEDPKALAKWVDDWRARTLQPTDPEFAQVAATWAAAARALENPAAGAQELARVCDLSSPLFNGLDALGSKMESHESRLTFLRSLHAATNGKFIPTPFVATVARRITFAQLAHLLDQAPTFDSEGSTDRFAIAGDPPIRLRAVAAHWSQDSTPKARWDWLAQKPEDLPTGRPLRQLVEQWAGHDEAGTAEWIAGLEPGPIRQGAEKSFANWKRSSQPRKP